MDVTQKIAITSLIVSFISFIANWLYSRYLFKIKEYPLIIESDPQYKWHSSDYILCFKNITNHVANELILNILIKCNHQLFTKTVKLKDLDGHEQLNYDIKEILYFILYKSDHSKFNIKSHNILGDKSFDAYEHKPFIFDLRTCLSYRSSLRSKRKFKYKCNYRISYVLGSYINRTDLKPIEGWVIEKIKIPRIIIKFKKISIDDSSIHAMWNDSE